jgi:hypothetical protein
LPPLSNKLIGSGGRNMGSGGRKIGSVGGNMSSGRKNIGSGGRKIGSGGGIQQSVQEICAYYDYLYLHYLKKMHKYNML